MPGTQRSTVMLLCALLIGGCAQVTPAPTPIPTLTLTAVPTSTATALPCTPDNVLGQVDAFLTGEIFEAHYLTINRQLVLSVWLVDASIDPEASVHDMAENRRRAFLRGASVAHTIAHQIPCTRQVFEGINPMIVDRGYNSWYIDVIPMRALPEAAHPTDEELMSAIERSGMEIAYLRRTPPQPAAYTVVEDGCTWPEARAGIQAFFGDGRRNAAAYLIIGQQVASSDRGFDPQAVVQAQWDVQSPQEMDEETVLANIEQMARALVCLSPRLDRLEVYVVDAAGRLLILGLVPGSVIEEDISPLPADRVRLHYVDEME